jgi:hypothetical protein
MHYFSRFFFFFIACERVLDMLHFGTGLVTGHSNMAKWAPGPFHYFDDLGHRSLCTLFNVFKSSLLHRF